MSAPYDDACPNCSEEWLEDDAPKTHRCPTCGVEGYECCFPAGNMTECLGCETGGDE